MKLTKERRARLKRYNLKLFRMKQGLTQTEMAKKLEVSMSHYRGIELGNFDPSFKVLQKFYDVFGNQYQDIWELFKRG